MADLEESYQPLSNKIDSDNLDKIVTGVLENERDVQHVITELTRTGFSREDINILSKADSLKNKTSRQKAPEDDLADGVLTGGTIGGIGGLILGAGALAIPGIGPVIALGPISAALTGVLVGGLAGGLLDWGIPANESKIYEQAVAEGHILAIVHTNSSKADSIVAIFEQYGAQQIEVYYAK